MLILDTVDKSLELVLGGAVATTQLPYIASYVDVNQSTFASNGLPASNGTSNGTTPVTVIAAPAATTSRKLNYFSVFNIDSAPVTAIIQLNDNATTRVTFKALLAVGDQIEFTDSSGWRVLDSTGAIKQSGSQGTAGINGLIGPIGQTGNDGFDADLILIPGPAGPSGAYQTPRVTAITSSSTPTPNADTTDLYDVTELAAAAAFGAPTGTPVNGQKLITRIKDNATPRALTWNSAYVAGGVALPTTTVTSKILTIGFMYNTANSLNKWMCIASVQEA